MEYGLIGEKLWHSFSKEIHNQIGDYDYVLKEIPREELVSFIKGKDFENISLHSLRHANATLLIMNGIDIKLVSAHLGHSSIAITGDMYADVLEKSKRQMADLISLSLNSWCLNDVYLMFNAIEYY